MGYWQKESEIEKMVGCFKVPLGWLIRVKTLCTFGFFGHCEPEENTWFEENTWRFEVILLVLSLKRGAERCKWNLVSVKIKKNLVKFCFGFAPCPI